MGRAIWQMLVCAAVLVGLAACAGPSPTATPTVPEGGKEEMVLKIESPAFVSGGDIPKRYTCDGPDVSPPLTWAEPPAGTQSLALICDDPDAPVGTWVHWVIYRLPATARGLPEGVPARETLDDGSRQGKNDFRKVGYGGPCPPRGSKHRYFFRLYALDTVPALAPGATKAQLLKAMEGHILAQGELMGWYGR
ncbi:MAG: YbhB/YbcL family Raf kinase inhibitor-like protein [Anaerolineae bacterium]